MSQPSPQHDPITPEKIEPLASGLWGSVFRITGTDTVVKVAKDVKTGLHFGEKRIYERLGDHPLITQYLGETMVQVEGEKKPGLLCRYYPLGTIKAFFKSPGSSEVCNLQSQQLRWAAQIVDALAYIHSCNIVHGDVGIHNILVANDHGLKFNDFGGSSLDGAEMLVENSPRYHRPHSWRFPIEGVDSFEETWKIPTKKMDTYATGTLLYEIFTGTELYRGETYDQIRRHATKPEYPDINLVMPVGVRQVILNCWSEKYDNMEEIIKDLEPIWLKKLEME